MPTLYRWDDASAPDLTGDVGSLVAVLDACLVNGYGAKAAAGWSTAYTSTHLRAYRQGANSNARYLRVDDSGTGSARVVGYETMSDINTGTGPFPTAAQFSGGGYIRKSSTTDTVARPWLVAADTKRFYLWVGYDLAEATGLNAGDEVPLYFFGDLISLDSGDPYNTFLLCGESASTLPSSAAIAVPTASLAGHYMPRNYAGVDGAIKVVKLSNMRPAASTSGALGVAAAGCAYPDPATGGMLLDPVTIVELTTVLERGILPGLYNPLHNLPGAGGDTFAGYGSQAGRAFLLLDVCNASTWARVALETTDWE
jgi:hypothetical protein